ncbi:MAG: glutamate-5-semialdehyde dehydrogenase, partial [Chloroflexi bacterium]|nr:glutamate-5-semialdehyde dehydrogenase [Chloroflexota bacterium]
MLLMLADQLIAQRDSILRENVKDVEAATVVGLASALVDRLTLNESRLNGVAADVRRVASLPDPVGEQFDHATLSNGLKLHKQRVPLGVLGVIYESRPNVTIDVTALAIKTGNAAILRGGSETLNTNRALINVVHHALEKNQLPVTAIQFIDDPDRARVTELLALHDYVDVIIPRGGAALHKFCRDNSRITVITGGIGICHLFVDESADLDEAIEVIHNAKTQRPSVCNALDVVLVHRAVAAEFLPRVVARLAVDGVTFRAEPRTISNLQSPISNVQLASETDFDTEWLSLVLSLKVVDDLDEALDHITQHSTAHSDGILTRDMDHANRFIAEVDSAAVYVNASTRFTDGGEFGLGAEVAVSTQRLHARGPMGLRELTTYKWVGVGDYHIRK